MAKRKTSPPATFRWDPDVRLLAWLATCVSVFSFLFYFRNGDVLLYGDAVAHINIARRVFDSMTPGLLQLGTVWLPLPHLLMMPFLISNEMWQRGAGGSIPSMVAYVFGVVGMFRLIRGALSRGSGTDAGARVAAWIAVLVYAANPNLIYMQATAMGESLYLAFFLWAMVYFSEWSRGERKPWVKCGLCVAAACLTRYDGWLLAATMAAVVILRTSLRRESGSRSRHAEVTKAAVARFVLLAFAAPALWLGYNGIVYRNPLEFENGPYSARAIEKRTQASGNPGHPGSGNPMVAGMYFVKSAESNLADSTWLGRLWVVFAAASLAAGVRASRPITTTTTKGTDRATLIPQPTLLLLLLPLPFYSVSIAYGGVPIFVPAWWPFTHYNDRYGLQMLPAFAAALAVMIYFAMRQESWPHRLRLAAAASILAFAAVSYASIWRAGPICLKEAEINMGTRNQLEAQLAKWLRELPPDSTLLMYLGDHVGALEQAGIPLRHVINEGNHRVWKQPEDTEGLWERALANPAKYAEFVVAFEGDPVWQHVHGLSLHELVEIHITGQARAIVYRTR